jgi:hypothetical protein
MSSRVADKVAQHTSRKIPGGTTSATPSPITNPAIAHGRTGSDLCVLTVGVRNSVSGPTNLTLYIFDPAMGEWVLGGGISTINTKAFASGSTDVFVLPEQSLFYLVSSQTLPDNAIWVDGTNLQGGLP